MWAGNGRFGRPDARPARALVILRPVEPEGWRWRSAGGGGSRRRGRRRGRRPATRSSATGDADREDESDGYREPGLPPTPRCGHSPQLNLCTPVKRARSVPTSSALPWTVTPRLGPIASTTKAARGSAVRLRSFTPSTSNSKAPESLSAYMTGTTCGQPDGPTEARRPIRCERRNSSSGSVKTTTTNPIVAAAALPLVDCGVYGHYRHARRGSDRRLHDRAPRATREARGRLHGAGPRADWRQAHSHRMH